MSDQTQFAFSDRPDPFARLPELAERLGVPETTGPDYLIMTKDGHTYSIFDLFKAVLDRLDRSDALNAANHCRWPDCLANREPSPTEK